MNEFAIVSEGVTDYAVLKNVLLGWFQNQQGAEPFLKPYQPDPTAEGESSWQQFGNWENVINYLKQKKHRDALEFADHLIIQIDTDQSEHENFGVSQREGDKQLDPAALVAKVGERLSEIIGPTDLEFYGNRIIFAICVREIECWLLPLWDTSKAAKCEGCLKAMNRALTQANKLPLNKDQDRYNSASKEYKKRKTLLTRGKQNPSLEIFLTELQARNITLSKE